jgi:hypothetical protein
MDVDCAFSTPFLRMRVALRAPAELLLLAAVVSTARSKCPHLSNDLMYGTADHMDTANRICCLSYLTSHEHPISGLSGRPKTQCLIMGRGPCLSVRASHTPNIEPFRRCSGRGCMRYMIISLSVLLTSGIKNCRTFDVAPTLQPPACAPDFIRQRSGQRRDPGDCHDPGDSHDPGDCHDPGDSLEAIIIAFSLVSVKLPFDWLCSLASLHSRTAGNNHR